MRGRIRPPGHEGAEQQRTRVVRARCAPQLDRDRGQRFLLVPHIVDVVGHRHRFGHGAGLGEKARGACALLFPVDAAGLLRQRLA
jgi:hypothetical protein